MSLDMLWSLKWFNPHLFSLNKLGFSLSIAFCWAWKCFEAWSDLKLEHASTAGFLSLWTSSLYQAELVSLYAGAEENMLVCGITSWWQSTIWPNKVEPCGNVETGWSPKSLVLLIFPANLFLSLSSPVVSKFQLSLVIHWDVEQFMVLANSAATANVGFVWTMEMQKLVVLFLNNLLHWQSRWGVL